VLNDAAECFLLHNFSFVRAASILISLLYKGSHKRCEVLELTYIE